MPHSTIAHVLIPGKIASYSSIVDVPSAMPSAGALNPPRPLTGGVPLDCTGWCLASTVTVSSISVMVHLVSMHSANVLSPSNTSSAPSRSLPTHGPHNGVTTVVSIETTLAEAWAVGPLSVHSSVIVAPGGPILVTLMPSTEHIGDKVVFGHRTSPVVSRVPRVMSPSHCCLIGCS